jgi:hypothetical protein
LCHFVKNALGQKHLKPGGCFSDDPKILVCINALYYFDNCDHYGKPTIKGAMPIEKRIAELLARQPIPTDTDRANRILFASMNQFRQDSGNIGDTKFEVRGNKVIHDVGDRDYRHPLVTLTRDGPGECDVIVGTRPYVLRWSYMHMTAKAPLFASTKYGMTRGMTLKFELLEGRPAQEKMKKVVMGALGARSSNIRFTTTHGIKVVCVGRPGAAGSVILPREVYNAGCKSLLKTNGMDKWTGASLRSVLERAMRDWMSTQPESVFVRNLYHGLELFCAQQLCEKSEMLDEVHALFNQAAFERANAGRSLQSVKPTFNRLLAGTGLFITWCSIYVMSGREAPSDPAWWVVFVMVIFGLTGLSLWNIVKLGTIMNNLPGGAGGAMLCMMTLNQITSEKLRLLAMQRYVGASSDQRNAQVAKNVDEVLDATKKFKENRQNTYTDSAIGSRSSGGKTWTYILWVVWIVIGFSAVSLSVTFWLPLGTPFHKAVQDWNGGALMDLMRQTLCMICSLAVIFGIVVNRLVYYDGGTLDGQYGGGGSQYGRVTQVPVPQADDEEFEIVSPSLLDDIDNGLVTRAGH